MATLEEMARLELEIAEAEVAALRNLAQHLRDAIIDLPIQSDLARAFSQYARTFELWATDRGDARATWAAASLESLRRRIAARDTDETGEAR